MTNEITRYQGFTAEDSAKVEEAVRSVSGSIWLKLSEGENVLRILPAPVGAWPVMRPTSVHYVDMPGASKTMQFNCPLFELKQPCQVCAEAQRLASSRNPADKKLAERLTPRAQVFANVLPRANPAGGPKVLGMGAMIWRKVNDLRNSKHSGGDMTDPTAAGYDLIIVREGTGQQTRYEVFPDRRSSALAGSEAEIEDILSRMHDLEALIDPNVPMDLIQAYAAASRASARGPVPQRSAVEMARAPVPALNGVGETTAPGNVYDENNPATWVK